MNLKPEEMVKALRCCAEGECSGCPMYADKQRCQEQTLASSADQIEHDQKEMAELRAALEKATEMAGALNKKCDLITKKLEQLSDAYHVVGDSDDAEGGLRMERLTFEGNFCEIARCKEVKCPYDTNCIQKQVWERLKAYEDTGIEPEAVETVKLALCAKHMVDLETLNNTPISRLVELAEADKDGRVTILPCRGDADIVLMRDGVAFKPDHWNIHLTTFAENQPTPSGKKVALFDLREVRELMEGMNE